MKTVKRVMLDPTNKHCNVEVPKDCKLLMLRLVMMIKRSNIIGAEPMGVELPTMWIEGDFEGPTEVWKTHVLQEDVDEVKENYEYLGTMFVQNGTVGVHVYKEKALVLQDIGL